MPARERTQCKISLPTDLKSRLDDLAGVNHVTRSAMIADAVRAWLERTGDDELEFRFAARLDSMSRKLKLIERIGRILLESLGLFIRYMLTINAPIPEGDETARAIGRDRFTAFIERVGRQVASGRSALMPEGEGE